MINKFIHAGIDYQIYLTSVLGAILFFIFTVRGTIQTYGDLLKSFIATICPIANTTLTILFIWDILYSNIERFFKFLDKPVFWKKKRKTNDELESSHNVR